MKIIDIAVKKVYRFNCPNYGTVNEFTKGELKWVKTSKNC